ncbi:hypothetical protein Dimus_024494 [Dionaea muscipula]
MMGDVVMMRGEDGEDERGGGLYGGGGSGLLFLGVIDGAGRGGDGGTGSGMGCTVVMGKLARSGDDMGSSCGDGATVVGNPFGLDNGRWLMGGDGAGGGQWVRWWPANSRGGDGGCCPRLLMMGDVVMMRGEDGEDERGGGLYGGWCSGLLFLGVIDGAGRGGDGGTGSGMGCTVVMGKLARSGDDMGSSCGDGATGGRQSFWPGQR